MFNRLKTKIARAVGNFVAQAAYEGATTGRRAANWFAPGGGANALLSGNLETLRNRSRESFRNNPWIERAITKNVDNEIGTGITPIFNSHDDDFNEDLDTVWWTWTGQSDPEGALDFYGQLYQSALCRRTSGEVFIRRRYRSATWGLAVPFQLQVLEPDHVPIKYNRDLSNGNKVRAGKEYNKRGRLVAFWMYPEHPGEQNLGFNNLIRVPARDVIHHYLPIRPGQIRGEPDIVQALLRAKTYDSYEDSELKRKETRSPFTGWITKEYTSEEDWTYDPLTGEEIEPGVGAPDINVEPGHIISGAHGEKLTLFDGDNTGSGYTDFQKQQLLAIASGVKSLYELMTGDWSKLNDRTYRAMIGEYRRGIQVAQQNLAIHQICDRVGYWFTDSAVANGVAKAPDYFGQYESYNRRDWRTQRWPHIHPTQDVNAVVTEIDNDLVSHDQAVAERGYQAGKVQEQNVKSKKRKQDLQKENGISSEG